MTQDELNQILDKHAKWLRGEDGGERANLRSANLRSANLRSANLRSANLSSADLSSADLSSANLRLANLSSANLSSANLSLANLRLANLRLANLSSANLSSANLSSANLSLANLSLAKNLEEALSLDYYKHAIWAVCIAMPHEVEKHIESLRAGRIDGSLYHGECACLKGDFAKHRECELSDLPVPADGSLPEEVWYANINPGDTPETSQVARITEKWLLEFQSLMAGALKAEPATA